MNCKRFTARNSREALTLVRQAFGEDAVVLSTKPCPEGVEVLAMAPDPDDRWRPMPVLVTRAADMTQCRGMRMGYAPSSRRRPWRPIAG